MKVGLGAGVTVVVLVVEAGVPNEKKEVDFPIPKSLLRASFGENVDDEVNRLVIIVVVVVSTCRFRGSLAPNSLLVARHEKFQERHFLARQGTRS